MRLCFSHFSHEQAYFSLHATQILAYDYKLKNAKTIQHMSREENFSE